MYYTPSSFILYVEGRDFEIKYSTRNVLIYYSNEKGQRRTIRLLEIRILNTQNIRKEYNTIKDVKQRVKNAEAIPQLQTKENASLIITHRYRSSLPLACYRDKKNTKKRHVHEANSIHLEK